MPASIKGSSPLMDHHVVSAVRTYDKIAWGVVCLYFVEVVNFFTAPQFPAEGLFCYHMMS